MRPPSPLALETNVAILAGAGTGKTHGLISLCLHLLGGAREGAEPLPPSRLCLVTFTDKAAGELRQRLRERLERLSERRVLDSEEVELRASFERLGRPWPKPAFWREPLEGLGRAFVGTFHALALEVLRRPAPGLAALPAFELLDEDAAQELLLETAERTVVEALEGGDPELTALCAELELVERGAAFALVSVFTRLREQGAWASTLGVGDEAEARRGFDAELAEGKRLLAQAQSALERSAKPALKFTVAARRAAEALHGMTFDNFLEPGRFHALADAFADPHLLKGGGAEVNGAFKALKGHLVGDRDTRLGLRAAWSAVGAAAHERAFKRLLGTFSERHGEACRELFVLDFAELLIRARDLLRDSPEHRRMWQARFGAVLVDEFQDTNLVQLELVTLLGERRDGAPRALEPNVAAVLELPLEERALAVVGDRKQSIYGFRGAEVGVFERMAQRLEAHAGQRVYFQENRRSLPGLLGFVNGVCASILRPLAEPRDYEVGYAAETDDLRATRQAVEGAPSVERLLASREKTVAETREKEAEALAVRLAQLLAKDATQRVAGRGEGQRAVRGGDIAILLRSFGPLDVYRRALARHGIPHRVVRGRGFYGAQEVLDFASFFRWLTDEEDNASLAAVLRSPFVGVSDASLLRLAVAGGGRLGTDALRPGGRERPLPLPAEEDRRLLRFLGVADELRQAGTRLPIALVFDRVVDALDLRARYAAGPYGEQALANLDKLRGLGARWDASRKGGLGRFGSTLLELADREPREAEAEALELSDPRAVQLLTIHAAKGLEWPIVCLPDLGGKGPPLGGEAMVYERSLGLGLRPRLPGEYERFDTARSRAIRDELKRREAAESGRVLYVALTRARDRLILSGESVHAQSWRAQLDAASVGPLAALLLDVKAEALVAPPAEARASVVVTAGERAEATAVLQRVRGAGKGPGESVRVGAEELLAEPLGEKPPGCRALHAAVLTTREDQDVRSRLRAVGAPEDERTRDALERALGLWSRSKVARRIAALGEGRVDREVQVAESIQGPEGEVQVSDRLDFLIEDEEGLATVLELVCAPPPEDILERFLPRMQLWAFLARGLLGPTAQVQSGLLFLWPDGFQLSMAPDAAVAPEVAERCVREAAAAFLASRDAGEAKNHRSHPSAESENL